MRQAMMGMAPLLQLSLLVAILSGQGLFIRKGLAAESESTISLECQVAGLEYQTAPACTCAHQLPVCPDGCQELIDEYYAACQDGVDTNVAGEVEEWNVVSAPQVKLLAEQCGCAAAERAHAAALWLLALALVAQFALLQ